MVDIKKLDDELYMSLYAESVVGDYKEIWSRLKNDKKILEEAIKIKKDKWGERDIVSGLAIVNCMLIDYKSIDSDIYNKLINSIYSNIDIARIVIDGYSNGGYSYLLISLWNHDLKLTGDQKAFAVNEAMNKIGTVKYKNKIDEYSSNLDKAGITDDVTTLIDVDGSVNPIGMKTKFEYFNYMGNILSDTQAHGSGAFDIRYQILRNPNWTLEEKQKLIMEFWYDDEVYEECLEEWEWAIINDYVYFIDDLKPSIEKDLLFEYSYDYLESLYNNEAIINMFNDKDIVNKIWSEIQFCKLMHELRPMKWELEFKPKMKVLSN